MPTTSEKNQFRRLTGDYGADKITDAEIKSYLDDAAYELTGDFATPVLFDVLLVQYHNEVVYKAAINWWWNLLAELSNKHSISVGQTQQNVGEKWERALQMIQQLEAHLQEIGMLSIDITIGNYSRYSKQTLRRIGGIREEDTNA